MQELIVLKDVAPYATSVGSVTPGTTTVQDFIAGTLALSEGAVAFFDENGVTIPLADHLTAATTEATQVQVKNQRSYQIGVGQADGTLKLSAVIDRLNSMVKTQDYAAPKKEKQYIGSDGTTGSNLSTVVTWTIGRQLKVCVRRTDRDEMPRPGDIRTYNYTIATATAATELTAFAALINADPQGFVTAAVISTNKGISITANDFGVTFELTFPTDTINSSGTLTDTNELLGVGVLRNGTGSGTDAGVGASQQMFVGQGTPAQMVEFENDSFAQKGYMDNYWEGKRTEKIWTVDSKVSTASTCGYIQSLVTWNKDNRDSNYRHQATVKQTVVIAYPGTVNASTKVWSGYGSNLTKAQINFVIDTLNVLHGTPVFGAATTPLYEGGVNSNL